MFNWFKSPFEKKVSRLRSLQRKQQLLMRRRAQVRAEALRVQQQIDEAHREVVQEAKVVTRETGTKLKVSGIVSGETFGGM